MSIFILSKKVHIFTNCVQLYVSLYIQFKLSKQYVICHVIYKKVTRWYNQHLLNNCCVYILISLLHNTVPPTADVVALLSHPQRQTLSISISTHALLHLCVSASPAIGRRFHRTARSIDSRKTPSAYDSRNC